MTPKPNLKMELESINGEVVYLNTIATLEDTIKDSKDNVLRASSRVSFERDMALVDDSIRRMKAEVKKTRKTKLLSRFYEILIKIKSNS